MKKLTTVVALAFTVAVALTACDTPESASPAPRSAASSLSPVQVDPALQAMVPKQFRDAGTIAGGANFQAPPFAMYDADGKTPSGAMVKVVERAAGMMGLKVDWTQMLIADIIPAMQAKKVYIGGSMMAADPGIIASTNIVTTIKNNQGILAVPANASQFDTFEGICGKNIGMGTSALATQRIVDDIGKVCVQEGKPAPKKTLLSATAAIVLATQSGQVDGGMIPAATVEYTAKGSGGKLVATKAGVNIGQKVDEGIEGFPVAKDQGDLANAFQKAIQKMMDDGDYAKILQQFEFNAADFETSSYLNRAS